MDKYRLFLVEDDIDIASSIKNQAEAWDYSVHLVHDFHDVMHEFDITDPHLVIMDIGLPFYNGYHWCTEIRKVSKVPIIFLSSASDNMNQVMAISMGADDFIAKPFEMSLLMAKIQASLRRSYDFVIDTKEIIHKGARLNTSDYTLEYNGSRIELTKNEYRILFELMSNKGNVVSRQRLMEKLWETDSFVDENTLSVGVNRLRKKLETQGLSDFIATKHGVGYIIGD